MKRNTLRFLVAICMSSMTVRAYAVPYYVNEDCGNDDWSGVSTSCQAPNGPKETIQAGIEATLQNGDEVIVADGSYFGLGNVDLFFKKFGVGMPRLITVRSENGPANCTINGQDVGRGFNFDHVLVGAIDRNAVVDGFTITRGRASTLGAGGAILISLTSPIIRNCVIKNSGEGALFGGGICIIKDGNPLIENCVIEGNEASEDGGGIYLGPAFGSQINADITDCTIQSNTARRGGGIYVLGKSDAHIKRCTIMNNTASNLQGGGITLDQDADVWIVNCFIAGNLSQTSHGGGIALLAPLGEGSRMQATIVNTVITGNTAIDGGGIFMLDNFEGTVANTSIGGNSASGAGSAIRRVTRSVTGNAFLDNAIVWGNTPSQTQIDTNDATKLTVRYSDIQGGWSGAGQNNIDADPLFLDPEGPDEMSGTADDDLRLLDDSPCIDAASNLLVPNDETDLDEDADTGELTPLDLDLFARFVDHPDIVDTGAPDPGPPAISEVVDMGPYEFDDCTTNADCGDDGDPCNGREICTSGNCEVVRLIELIANEPAQPAHEESLWRSDRNIVRLTFECDISAPGSRDVLVRKMLPDGGFDVNLAVLFTFTVEDNGGGPRVLKINEKFIPQIETLEHREWYSFQNIGAWSGMADFEVQYVVMAGDATNDNRVVNADVLTVNARVPTFDADDDAREDIDGDGRILSLDVLIANSNVPSFPPAKPSGH